MTIAQEMAHFCSALEYEAIPENVRQKALELLADWLANAAAGNASLIGQALADVVGSRPVSDGVPLAATLRNVDPLSAAMINAGAAHATEFDDSDRVGLYHPGAPVISAAWAAAAASVRVADMVTGIIAGYEISQRLARAVNPSHYGCWHTTGTVGSLGAAAAASRTLRLAPQETTWALGLAGTQAAGLWEVLPEAPLAKNLHPAKAAHSGVLAAMLSAKGIHGPGGILEGERGFFKAMVPGEVKPDACLDGLGEQWLIVETTVKAYPVCGHTMTPIEAAFQLRSSLPLHQLESVDVYCDPIAIQVAGNPSPVTEAQAKFSIPYCVALALVRGEVGLDGFLPQAIDDPEVRRVMALIQLVPSSDHGREKGRRPARLVLRLQSGETREATAHYRKGDPENPLTDAEREEKFKNLTLPVWGEAISLGIWGRLAEMNQFKWVRQWWQSLPIPKMQLRGTNGAPKM